MTVRKRNGAVLAAAILLAAVAAPARAQEAHDAGPVVRTVEAPSLAPIPRTPLLEPPTPGDETSAPRRPASFAPLKEPAEPARPADRDRILQAAVVGALLGCALGVFMGPEEGSAFGCAVGAAAGAGLGALMGSGL